MNAISKMKLCFEVCLIRRMATSKDYEGNEISGLPPVQKYKIFLEMKGKEREQFVDHVERVRMTVCVILLRSPELATDVYH